MASNDPVSPHRSPARIALGLLMIGFSIYRLIMFLSNLPDLLNQGGVVVLLPAFMVVVFFVLGVELVRQGYYGPDKPKREE